jgi:hypothetical protein
LHLEENGLAHGTRVIKVLVLPWVRSGRLVVADSYFASVATAEELYRLGLRFTGVVKTTTRRFPMKELGSTELFNRGDRRSLLSLDANGTPWIPEFVWMDRDRRYFVSTASSLAPGVPYNSFRWRKISEDIDTAPERIELTVTQPEATQFYYDACGKIDRHNRCRQDDLKLEKNIGTMDWSAR